MGKLNSGSYLLTKCCMPRLFFTATGRSHALYFEENSVISSLTGNEKV